MTLTERTELNQALYQLQAQTAALIQKARVCNALVIANKLCLAQGEITDALGEMKPDSPAPVMQLEFVRP